MIVFFIGIALLAIGFLSARLTTSNAALDVDPPAFAGVCWVLGIVAVIVGGLTWG